MKIGFFTEIYYPKISGVVENIDTSAAALRKKGHEVFIIAPKTPGFKSTETDVFWLPSIKLTKAAEFRVIVPLPDQTMRKLMGMQFDIVHGHAGGPACFLGWEVARRKKIPYIITYHTLLNRYTHYVFNGLLFTPKMAEIGTRIFCNLTSHVIAPTQIVKKELLSYGVKTPISVIPGGINLSRFTDREKGYLRNKLGIKTGQTILLYVGRLGKEKNISFLLKSYSKLGSEASGTVFVVVGDGSDRKKLQKLAEDLGIAAKVFFTGFVQPKDIPLVYADADIFLFSSKTETQGLVVAEAMASKLPILVVEDDAFENVVIDEQTGLVAKNSISNFSSKLTRLINDQQLRTRLGTDARSLVEEEFSDNKQADRLIEIYEKEIDKKIATVTNKGLIKEGIKNLNAFLSVSERLNRFKEVTRFINGRNN